MKKILYVEDSLASQVLMRRFLKTVCEVEAVASEAEAIQRMQANEYGLLLLDYHLGERDTFNLLQNVRMTSDAYAYPILVLSSSMDLALETRVLKAGANDAIGKPVDPVDLRTMIERLLEEPYVRKPEKAMARVFCFEWKSPKGYHQFSPEVGVEVCKPTKQEAVQAMAEILKSRETDSRLYGLLSEQKMTTHLVELEAEVEPAESV